MATRTTSTTDAARELGMSPQMLNKHARTKGAPCDVQADGSRLFDVDELRAWMTTTGSVRANGSNRAGAFAGGGGTALELQMELKREQVRELKIRNGQKEGRLIDVDDVRQATARKAMEVRAGLDGVASKAASRIVAALQLPADRIMSIREIVQAEVHDAMRGLIR